MRVLNQNPGSETIDADSITTKQYSNPLATFDRGFVAELVVSWASVTGGAAGSEIQIAIVGRSKKGGTWKDLVVTRHKSESGNTQFTVATGVDPSDGDDLMCGVAVTNQVGFPGPLLPLPSEIAVSAYNDDTAYTGGTITIESLKVIG
jgi:hypothetical protein